MVENGGNASKALRDAGYSESIANNPQKVTKTESFQDILKEAGLTDQFLTKALVADIKSKKGRRKAELELGYKVLGRLKEGGGGNTTNNLIVVSDEQAARIAARLAGRSDGNG